MPKADRPKFVPPEKITLTLAKAVCLGEKDARRTKLHMESILTWSDASRTLTDLPVTYFVIGKKYNVTRREGGYVNEQGQSVDTMNLVSAVLYTNVK